MSANGREAKVNESTFLIDIGMSGISGACCVYLVKGEKKTCLIDCGPRKESPNLVRTLRKMNSFPPDLVIITHAHWDHAQGVPFLRKEAARLGKTVEVLASSDAIPLLADSSFNKDYEEGPYESIADVKPLKEGDFVDLGGLRLEIYDVPGHCMGHIAVFDSKNKNLFAGDSLGNRLSEKMFMGPFTPPSWDTDSYMASVAKMRRIPFNSVCFSHFGCVAGDEAKKVLDQSIGVFRFWWQVYAQNEHQLEDTASLSYELQKAMNPKADVKRTSPLQIAMVRVASALGVESARRIMLFRDHLRWLAKGYAMYRAAHR